MGFNFACQQHKPTLQVLHDASVLWGLEMGAHGLDLGVHWAHLELYGLQLATVASPVAHFRGEQNVIGRDAEIGDAFLSTDHPDDNIGHAVLGLRQ